MSAVRLSRREFLRGRLHTPLFARTLADEGAEQAADAPRSAQIDLRACLSSASQVCTVCSERCGARGAIEMKGMLPFVAAARCTGCGECAAACPSPGTAIRMVRARAGVR